MADIVIENTENKIKVQQLSDWEVRILNLPYAKSPQKQYRISNDKTIKICPLWAYEKGGNDIINNTLALPIAPSDIMFDNESDTQTLKLMNLQHGVLLLCFLNLQKKKDEQHLIMVGQVKVVDIGLIYPMIMDKECIMLMVQIMEQNVDIVRHYMIGK